ncbi:MAG: L,D-transpeptidase family protein [Lentisphaeria bacterium]|nr:L,D-transpeptidase family protein [Lentisphaeria bacterium]
MNPYYKYPLLVILALSVIGLAFLIYQKLPEKPPVPIETEEVSPTISTRPASGAPTPLPVSHDPAESSKPPLTPPPETPSVTQRNLIKAARLKLAQTDLLGARQLAEQVLKLPGAEAHTPIWGEAAEIISQVNTTLINGDAPAPEKVRYEVRSGDNLVTIARAHNTTVAALIRGNNTIDRGDATIYPGMVFNIYRGKWTIVASKRHFTLTLNDGDRLFKLYHVAIGKEGRTPVGTFKIKNKLREPAWTPPGKNIPFGDPENVLGTRWLGIVPTGATDPSLRGYGIHGTWEPQSIGSAASQGCLRMHNKDVEELFDIVPVGTPVIIKD